MEKPSNDQLISFALGVVYETEVQQHEEGLAHDALMTLSEAADTDSQHYITVGVCQIITAINILYLLMGIMKLTSRLLLPHLKKKIYLAQTPVS